MGQVTSQFTHAVSSVKSYFLPTNDSFVSIDDYGYPLVKENCDFPLDNSDDQLLNGQINRRKLTFDIQCLSTNDERAIQRQGIKRPIPDFPTKLPLSTNEVLPKKKQKFEELYLDFPFLDDKKTIDYINKSKVVFILRGLPGSGKSKLANAIERKLDSIEICSADDFFIKDGLYVFYPEKLREAHTNCQKKAVEAIQNQSNLVIDNTNIRLWEMKFYLNLAKEYNYTCIVLEPKTPWKTDVSILAEKNTHNLDEEKLQWKLDAYETLMPLYYGWFLNEKDSSFLGETAFNWLQQCFRCEEFLEDFSWHTGIKDYNCVNEWFKTLSKTFHCVSKFTRKLEAPGSTEYIAQMNVINSIGKVFDIEIIGFIITPRTFGARVRLSNDMLQIWGANDHEEVPEFFWTLGSHSDSGELIQTSQESLYSDVVPDQLGPIVEELINGNSNEKESQILPSQEEPHIQEIVIDGIDANNSLPTHVNGGTSEEFNAVEVNENVNLSENQVTTSIVEPFALTEGYLQETSKSVPICNFSNVTHSEESIKIQSNHPTVSDKGGSKSPVKKKSPRKGGSAGVPIPPNDLALSESVTSFTYRTVPQVYSESDRYCPTTGNGSRAHITITCGVEEMPVTTGLDLIFAIENEKLFKESNLSSLEIEKKTNCSSNLAEALSKKAIRPSTHSLLNGTLIGYGNGLWVIYPNEKLLMSSLFSSFQS